MNGTIKLKATSPCLKFINAKPEQQMAKIREEVEEVAVAWAAFEKEKTEETLIRLFEELLDVKACVNTAIAQIHYAAENETARRYAESRKLHDEGQEPFIDYLIPSFLEMEAKRLVTEKNARRGYYWEDKEE